MSIKDSILQNTGKLLNKSKDNNGAFLFVTLAASWILASCAQTIGLISNKKLSKEDKKFLVPQEIMDGSFNIASYAGVTVPLMCIAGKLASKKYPANNKAVEGVKTTAAIVGGIISSNIVTPILRNRTSAFIKKKMEEKKGHPVTPIIYNSKSYPYFMSKNNHPLTLDNYKQITGAKSYSGTLKI